MRNVWVTIVADDVVHELLNMSQLEADSCTAEARGFCLLRHL